MMYTPLKKRHGSENQFFEFLSIDFTIELLPKESIHIDFRHLSIYLYLLRKKNTLEESRTLFYEKIRLGNLEAVKSFVRSGVLPIDAMRSTSGESGKLH